MFTKLGPQVNNLTYKFTIKATNGFSRFVFISAETEQEALEKLILKLKSPIDIESMEVSGHHERSSGKIR